MVLKNPAKSICIFFGIYTWVIIASAIAQSRMPSENPRNLNYFKNDEQYENTKDSNRNLRFLIKPDLFNSSFAPVFYEKISMNKSNNLVSSTGSWRSLGPVGGLIGNVLMHPTDHRILFAHTFYDPPTLFFKSKNSGDFWRLISTIPDYFDASAIDPNHPSVLYTGNRKFINKSTDGALTWSQVELFPKSDYLVDIQVCPTNSNIIYAGTTYTSNKAVMAIYKSMDGGQNWNRYDVAPDDYEMGYVRCLSVNPHSSNVLYIGGGVTMYPAGQGLLFKSTDGGASWTNIYGRVLGIVNALAIDPTSANTINAGTSVGIFRSDDGGSHWLQDLSSLSSASLAIDPKNTNNIYSVYSTTPQIFKSVDRGRHWIIWGKEFQGNVSALLVDYYQTNNLFIGNLYGIYKSSNAGLDWVKSNDGLVASQTKSIGIALSDPRKIYIEVANRDIAKTTNSGDIWIELPEFSNCGNFGAITVHPQSPDIVFALEGQG